MDERNEIPITAKLLLINSAKDKLNFKIEKIEQRDLNSLSYVAKSNHANTYYLKEYYPEADLGGPLALRRSRFNYLSLAEPNVTNASNFTSKVNDFLLPYVNYIEKRNYKDDFKDILPEVSYVRPKFSNRAYETGSIYIYHPLEVEGYSLKKLIKEGLSKNVYKTPIRGLKVLIKALKTLITLAQELSLEEGNFYLDLNPDNYQFKNDFTDNETLYLKRLNFLTKDMLPFGKTDAESYIIKSVGNILKEALKIDHEADPNELDVEKSFMFQNNEDLANSEITSSVYFILKHCLSTDEQYQYKSLEGLQDDLDQLFLKLNSRKSRSTNFNKKSTLERKYNRKFSIANTLFRNPIKLNEDSDKIRLAVFGLGNSGSACVDSLLQLGQIGNKQLEITVFSHWIEKNAENYLESRPYLSQFTTLTSDTIDTDSNSLFEPKNPNFGAEDYAQINFNRLYGIDENDKEEFSSSSKKTEIVKGSETIFGLTMNLLIDEEQNRPLYDALFICFGDDKLNKRFAESVLCEICDLGLESPRVYYALSNDRYDELKASGKAYLSLEESFDYTPEERDFLLQNAPVPIFMEKEEVDPILEQMAFSLHSIWNNFSRENLNDSFNKFKENLYHYSSSILSALGLLNNLSIFKLNTEFNDEEDLRNIFLKTAKAFKENVKFNTHNLTPDIKKAVLNAHKNWLFGKITDGWGAPFDPKTQDLDYDGIVGQFELKNEKKKLHPRILPANEELPLREAKYSPKRSLSLWNDLNAPIPDSFDPTDVASLKMHRANLKLADDLRQSYPINLNLDILKILTENEKEKPFISNSLDNLILCLKNCQNGNQAFASKFSFYIESLRSNLKTASTETNVLSMLNYLDSVEKNFKPLVRSNVYRDLKSDNLKIVENIPFILTNKEIPSIVQVLKIQDENDRIEDLYRNLLSACLINPKDLTYLVYIDKLEDFENFFKTFLRLFHFYEFYGSGAKLNFRIYINPNNFDRNDISNKNILLNQLLDSNQSRFSSPKDSRLESMIIINDIRNRANNPLKDFSNTLQSLESKGQLTYIDLSQDLFRDETLQRQFEELAKENYKTYKIDPTGPKFYDLNNCEELAYTPERLKFTNSDLLALNTENLGFDDANTEVEFYLHLFLSSLPILAPIKIEPIKQKIKTEFILNQYTPDLKNVISNLWNIYLGGIDSTKKQQESILYWEELCDDLAGILNQDMANYVTLKKQPGNKVRTYFYSDLNYDYLKVILNWLIDNEIVSKDSTLQEVSSDTCKLELIDVSVDEPTELDKILDFTDHILDIDQLEFSPVNPESDYHSVKFKDLKVRKYFLNNKQLNDIYKKRFLTALESEHFIKSKGINKNQDNDRNFDFSLLKYRELLYYPTLLPLLHYYYSFVRSLEFDDVSCVVFNENFGEVDRTYYLIVTKGVRSAIVYVSCEAYEKSKRIQDRIAKELEYLVTRKVINPSVIKIITPTDEEVISTTSYDEKLKVNTTTIKDLNTFTASNQIINQILKFLDSKESPS